MLIQANHFKVPNLWRQWLQKYKLVSVQQIAAASTVEGLKELFQSAQTSESLIICLSDRANIKLFQATCENMAKMLNAPANSEQHELFLQGLKANLDQAFYKIHSVHPATDAILEPGIALKLANELRALNQNCPFILCIKCERNWIQ